MARCTVAEGTTEKSLPEQRSHVLKTGAPRSLVALRSKTSPLPPHLHRAWITFFPPHTLQTLFTTSFLIFGALTSTPSASKIPGCLITSSCREIKPVNGVLGYEAQLVNAVIASSSAIHGRFHYRYGGDWERCTRTQEVTREKHGKNGKYNVTERVRGWTDEDEIGLFVLVGAILRGESEITWGEPLYLSGVVTRNSPLWVSNPKQQIAYLGVKYWARLYCPEVILGVYSPDAVEQRTEREINPTPAQRMSVAEITSGTDITTSAQNSALNIDSLADDFRDRIERAESVDAAKAIRADLDKEKAVLGTVLFTELKGKAVQRYFMVDARNKVEAAINSLPNPGEPEAVELFAKAEGILNGAKRHLGDELYDQFRITLDDMKPEYVG